jgi:hypothetical protein
MQNAIVMDGEFFYRLAVAIFDGKHNACLDSDGYAFRLRRDVCNDLFTAHRMHMLRVLMVVALHSAHLGQGGASSYLSESARNTQCDKTDQNRLSIQHKGSSQ